VIIVTTVVIITILIVCFFSLILSVFEEFSSELTSSIELDVLTRRIKEAKTLGVGEVQAPDDESKNKEDKNDEEVQPPEIGIDFLDALFDTRRGHFFGRSLTARSTGPAAEISGDGAAAGIGVWVVGALSSAAVRGTVAIQRGEEVALRIGVAGSAIGGHLGARRHGANVIDDQASGIEEALGFVGLHDGDAVGAADISARAVSGELTRRLTSAVVGGEADGLLALVDCGVPDTLVIRPARVSVKVTTELIDANTFSGAGTLEPAAERIGLACELDRVDTTADGAADTHGTLTSAESGIPLALTVTDASGSVSIRSDARTRSADGVRVDAANTLGVVPET
jgi:hypothetical protein